MSDDDEMSLPDSDLDISSPLQGASAFPNLEHRSALSTPFDDDSSDNSEQSSRIMYLSNTGDIKYIYLPNEPSYDTIQASIEYYLDRDDDDDDDDFGLHYTPANSSDEIDVPNADYEGENHLSLSNSNSNSDPYGPPTETVSDAPPNNSAINLVLNNDTIEQTDDNHSDSKLFDDVVDVEEPLTDGITSTMTEDPTGKPNGASKTNHPSVIALEKSSMAQAQMNDGSKHSLLEEVDDLEEAFHKTAFASAKLLETFLDTHKKLDQAREKSNERAQQMEEHCRQQLLVTQSKLCEEEIKNEILIDQVIEYKRSIDEGELRAQLMEEHHRKEVQALQEEIQDEKMKSAILSGDLSVAGARHFRGEMWTDVMRENYKMKLLTFDEKLQHEQTKYTKLLDQMHNMQNLYTTEMNNMKKEYEHKIQTLTTKLTEKDMVDSDLVNKVGVAKYDFISQIKIKDEETNNKKRNMPKEKQMHSTITVEQCLVKDLRLQLSKSKMDLEEEHLKLVKLVDKLRDAERKAETTIKEMSKGFVESNEILKEAVEEDQRIIAELTRRLEVVKESTNTADIKRIQSKVEQLQVLLTDEKTQNKVLQEELCKATEKARLEFNKMVAHYEDRLEVLTEALDAELEHNIQFVQSMAEAKDKAQLFIVEKAEEFDQMKHNLCVELHEAQMQNDLLRHDCKYEVDKNKLLEEHVGVLERLLDTHQMERTELLIHSQPSSQFKLMEEGFYQRLDFLESALSLEKETNAQLQLHLNEARRKSSERMPSIQEIEQQPKGSNDSPMNQSIEDFEKQEVNFGSKMEHRGCLNCLEVNADNQISISDSSVGKYSVECASPEKVFYESDSSTERISSFGSYYSSYSIPEIDFKSVKSIQSSNGSADTQFKQEDQMSNKHVERILKKSSVEFVADKQANCEAVLDDKDSDLHSIMVTLLELVREERTKCRNLAGDMKDVTEVKEKLKALQELLNEEQTRSLILGEELDEAQQENKTLTQKLQTLQKLYKEERIKAMELGQEIDFLSKSLQTQEHSSGLAKPQNTTEKQDHIPQTVGNLVEMLDEEQNHSIFLTRELSASKEQVQALKYDMRKNMSKARSIIRHIRKENEYLKERLQLMGPTRSKEASVVALHSEEAFDDDVEKILATMLQMTKNVMTLQNKCEERENCIQNMKGKIHEYIAAQEEEKSLYEAYIDELEQSKLIKEKKVYREIDTIKKLLAEKCKHNEGVDDITKHLNEISTVQGLVTEVKALCQALLHTETENTMDMEVINHELDKSNPGLEKCLKFLLEAVEKSNLQADVICEHLHQFSNYLQEHMGHPDVKNVTNALQLQREKANVQWNILVNHLENAKDGHCKEEVYRQIDNIKKLLSENCKQRKGFDDIAENSNDNSTAEVIVTEFKTLCQALLETEKMNTIRAEVISDQLDEHNPGLQNCLRILIEDKKKSKLQTDGIGKLLLQFGDYLEEHMGHPDVKHIFNALRLQTEKSNVQWKILMDHLENAKDGHNPLMPQIREAQAFNTDTSLHVAQLQAKMVDMNVAMSEMSDNEVYFLKKCEYLERQILDLRGEIWLLEKSRDEAVHEHLLSKQSADDLAIQLERTNKMAESSLFASKQHYNTMIQEIKNANEQTLREANSQILDMKAALSKLSDKDAHCEKLERQVLYLKEEISQLEKSRDKGLHERNLLKQSVDDLEMRLKRSKEVESRFSASEQHYKTMMKETKEHYEQKLREANAEILDMEASVNKIPDTVQQCECLEKQVLDLKGKFGNLRNHAMRLSINISFQSNQLMALKCSWREHMKKLNPGFLITRQ